MNDGARSAHWADEIAAAVESTGREPVLSTGISPSGEIHIGNMREVLTADAVFRALRDRGGSPGFNYVADDLDPLRKVYAFLDESSYAPQVGRPLSSIDCPCGEHASYADHFLEPFLAALRELHVEVEVERACRMYDSGRMTPYVVRALERRDRIAAILGELTGKRFEADWSPFQPICEACGRMSRATTTGFSAAAGTIDYRCACGGEGTRPIAGGGKLTWRVDWPARWSLLGVTVEPFGKDHATDGGSYDTGVRIAREVFEREPPFPVPYEWIRLSGGGDMSSSRGNVLSISGMLEVVPPEALRYFVMREPPRRSLQFDPGLPLLQLVDELDDPDADGRDVRAVELSRAGGEFRRVGVPFKHLVVVAQVARFDVDTALSVFARGGVTGLDREAIAGRLGHARRWLERHAPANLRFTVRESLPPEADALDDAQRMFLGRLADALRPGMDGQAVHEAIYELGEGLKPAARFKAIYLALLGQTFGPRAGWFVSLLGAEPCARRFREAAGSATGAGPTPT